MRRGTKLRSILSLIAALFMVIGPLAAWELLSGPCSTTMLILCKFLMFTLPIIGLSMTVLLFIYDLFS